MYQGKSAGKLHIKTEFNPYEPGQLAKISASGDQSKKEAKVETEKTKKAVKTIQAKVEKSTLGDLGALAEIRAKMDDDAAGKEA